MSMLASLARAYERLPDKPAFGYTEQQIGHCIVLGRDGSVADIADCRGDDENPSRLLPVPLCPPRTKQIRPNFMWDNVNYVLGAGKIADPTDQRFDAFRDKHIEFLDHIENDEVAGFCEFLRNWKPVNVSRYFDVDKLPSVGIVFGFVDSHRERYLHELPDVQEFWSSERKRWVDVPGKETADAVCLVTGRRSEIARTHPSIKGVWGAQPSGAAIVAFNSDAYESYGHTQGDNAPISEYATFAYTTALNRFLKKESGHRIQIGDTSTVFWAEASDAATARDAESLFAAFMDPTIDEPPRAKNIETHLDQIRQGKNLEEIAPDLARGVRFCVLGLAPNAARISVRFWWENDFGTLTTNYQRHLEDMKLDPPPYNNWPPLWHYLYEIAAQRKGENIPPLVAGEWVRAILNGTPYPFTLLSTVLMRIRADKEINALRVAMLKSVLIRNLAKEVPVALDEKNTNKGYILGRFFAVYEEVQRSALGGNVNTTIRHKYYGAASATPRKIFRTLDAGAQHHLSKLRQNRPGRAVNLEGLLDSIAEMMDPSGDPIPAALNAAEQALFSIGYYHQRKGFFRKSNETNTETDQ